MEYRELYPSYVEPKDWRDAKEKEKLNSQEWKMLRKKLMEQKNYTCEYCGFKYLKWQIAHHIDHDKNHNNIINLAVMCQMCNLVHHSGLGCDIFKVVELYKKSKYKQGEIINITRKMRHDGKNDEEIINYLGLDKKVPFRMNEKYLKPLFGFVTNRFEDKQKTI